jgi:hypothetical protein
MQLDLFPTGPLGRTARPFADTRQARPDAPAMLARLIDLRGGVHLAEQLDDVWAAREVEQPIGAPWAGDNDMQATLHTIEARLNDAFEHAMRARYRLPDPARIAHLASAARDRKRAVRAMWAPFAEFLEVHHKRARFALGELTRTVQGELLAMGGDTVALVRTAQAVEVATATRMADLRRTIAQSIEGRVARATHRISLREGDLLWAALAPIFEDGRALYRALYLHQRQALTDLVDACARL